MSAPRIAILLHRNQTERDLGRYLIKYLAALWRHDGLEVLFISGPRRLVPADVLIVHVDLSIVPDEYLEFARQYPAALNARVRDIRKTTFSKHRLGADDAHGGRVIVKSNLNYGGSPERALSGLGSASRLRVALGSTRAGSRFAGWWHGTPGYAIYERIEDVPARCFASDEWVVERFTPEFENGRYHVRYLDFLGDHHTCLRTGSDDPIIRGDTVIECEEVDPHPEVLEWRRRLGLDYGKLDYVVHDGEVVLLDVNKTSGAGAVPLSPGARADRRRHWANGIYAYLSDGAVAGGAPNAAT